MLSNKLHQLIYNQCYNVEKTFLYTIDFIQGENLHETCGIDGTWKNDLGSYINVNCGSGRTISGLYRIPVSSGEDTYEFSGKYIVTGGDGKDRIVAFLVPWNNPLATGNSNSSTSYTGIYYDSERVIYAHWILTGYKMWASRWATNLIGHAIFHRV
ncbi:hypothetical protein ACJMK2_014714 [Sinanodonta woodiana]|uniref:Uncharacterized protein n=1 Tax=Sinanodonta woodiana TaxID=1069815 RepID=A0ABD3V1U7_SINWO